MLSDDARERVSSVGAQLIRHAPNLAALLVEAEQDLLAFYRFPDEHATKLRVTNPLERVNRENGGRSDVVGIDALIRLAGMLPIEQDDEWLVARRHLSQESLAELPSPPEGKNSPTITSYAANRYLTYLSAERGVYESRASAIEGVAMRPLRSPRRSTSENVARPGHREPAHVRRPATLRALVAVNAALLLARAGGAGGRCPAVISG
jgi:hypothetical protein